MYVKKPDKGQTSQSAPYPAVVSLNNPPSERSGSTGTAKSHVFRPQNRGIRAENLTEQSGRQEKTRGGNASAAGLSLKACMDGDSRVTGW